MEPGPAGDLELGELLCPRRLLKLGEEAGDAGSFHTERYEAHRDVMEDIMREFEADETELSRADDRRRAMRHFMEANGLNPTEWARKAELKSPNPLYNFLNGHSLSLSQQTLEKLVRAVPGATVAELLGEQHNRTANVLVLPVRVIAEAGVWRPSYEIARAHEIEIAMPPRMAADEVAKIGDDHANEIYPAGSYVTVQSLASMRRALRNHDLVLLHRVSGTDGRHEVTVREVKVTKTEDGTERAFLAYRSNAPQFRGLLAIPWPYRGEVFRGGKDRLQIRGRIVMMTVVHDTTD